MDGIRGDRKIKEELGGRTWCWVRGMVAGPWLEDVKADLCRVRGQNGGRY